MNAQPSDKKALIAFLRAFILPTLAGKVAILYFGLNYSKYPGEGYGYGLAASLLFMLTMLSTLVYKFWNVEDL